MATECFSCAVPSEQFYEEMIHNAAAYNRKISHETKMRLPFLDSQTGVAQRHTSLFMPYINRQPGERKDQLYTYPAKRWKKKKSAVPLNEDEDSKTGEVENESNPATSVENTASRDGQEDKLPNKRLLPTTANPIPTPSFSYAYYDDWDAMSEPLDAGEIEHRDSDSSDFEETYIKKKRKKAKPKGGARGGGRKPKEPKEKKEPVLNFDHKTSYDEEQEKPYSCDICSTRYKTKPGVIYHMTHHHNNLGVDEAETAAASPKPPTLLPQQTAGVVDPNAPPAPKDPNAPNPDHGKYCDFCLGDEKNNKKTNQSEELVSCADCGRSGHPTCLQFTANMIISVKKYPWQCIECKSCGLCGTSENDDQLLFCDDCDRGFHMYCLKPPISEPPEGNWSCHLCIVEFYGGVKPEGME